MQALGPGQAKRARMPRTMCTSSLVHVLWVGRLHALFVFLSSVSFFLVFPPSSRSFSHHSGIGCGLWQPEAEPLGLLREDIDANADQWKEVLRAPEMRREFLGGAADDDEAVVKAFAHHNRESALKTKPKVS